MRSSSIFVRKMVADSDQASDQLEAQTPPIGAQNGQRQRLWTDQNPVGGNGGRTGREKRCAWPGTQGDRQCRCYPSGHHDGASRLPRLRSPPRVSTAPNGLFNGLIWPKSSAMRFDRFSATASSQLSSPDGRAAIPRGTRKFLLCCPAPKGGAPAFVSGRSIAIEAAMVRARKRKTET